MNNYSKTNTTFNDLLTRKKYDGKEVIETLITDFHSKCYICGSKIEKDLVVEHFVPHQGKDNLKYSWDNLFLACSYCNGIKSNVYNTNGYEICNVLNDDISCIEHRVKSYGLGIEIVSTNVESKYVNTVEMLNKVYVKYPKSSAAGDIKRTALKKNIECEYADFLNHFFTLRKNMENNEVREIQVALLKGSLHERSAYIEFKKQIIEDNPAIKNFLKEVGVL